MRTLVRSWTFELWLPLSVVAVLGSGGCDSDSNKAKDAATDAPHEGGGDAPADMATDSSSDGGMDLAVDAPMDGGSDLAVDAPTDGGSDRATDGGSEVAIDTGSDVHMDSGTDVVIDSGVDLPPATMLTVTVLDRRQTSFQLRWPAPAATGGGSVAGYDVRVAKVPITSTNFDDAAVTKTFTYTGTPAAPGSTDSMVVSGLNIEQDYYFAVAGKDAGGTRGTLMATTTAVTATFLTTVLSGTGTDGIGIDVDGAGDFGSSNRSFTADGFSDLIVGGTGGVHVYVYFGSAAGYPTTPSITITGTVTNFGQAVVNAGDLDGDGLDDIAISSPGDGNGKVFVFSRKNPPASWGTTNAWPATLTDTQATYTLIADTTFAGGVNSIFRRALARLGNFDGTGTSDLAVGFRLHGANLGAVLVVKGSSSFASRTIPDPAATSTIEIDGMTASGQLGISIIGIGQFFPTPSGPTLVAAAPLASSVYAFRGQAPTGALTTANADDSVVATPTTDQYGINLGYLGPLGGSPGAVTIASTAGKYVDVHLGTASSGPFLGTAGGAPSASVRFVDAQSGNSFGVVNLGGGIRGTSTAVSFVGADSVPDLLMAGQAETANPLYIVSGAALPTLSGMVDVSAAQTAVVPPVVKISNRLPSPWSGYASTTAIPDVNKDGYADFAVGESAFGAAGRVVVFY